MANQINTRIQLKYDSLSNWTTHDPVLLSGEIAIATLASDIYKGTDTSGSVSQHPVLFKVGNGTAKFSQLPWVSALAADVHDWAKSSTVVLSGTEIQFKTGDKVNHRIDLSSFATDLEVENLLKGYYTKTEIDGLFGNVVNTVTTVAEGTGISVTDAGENGNHAYTVALNVEGAKTALGLKSAAYTDSTDYATAAQGAKADSAVQAVSISTGSAAGKVKLTVDGKDTEAAVNGLGALAFKDSLAKADVGLGNVDNTADSAKPVSVAQQAAIDAALAAAKKYADDNDANDNTEYHVEYDSVNKKIKLVAGADASKMEIPTDDFIKDGMIQSVAISDDGKNLVITWNTDAGKEATEIALSELVDVMTGVDGATIKVEVSADDKISAEVKTGTLKDGHIASDAQIAKGKLATAVQTSLGLADTALQTVKIFGQDLSKGSNEITVEQGKSALGLGSAAYVTVDSLNATAKGYADAITADSIGAISSVDSADQYVQVTDATLSDDGNSIGYHIGLDVDKVKTIKVSNAGAADTAAEATHASSADEATHAGSADAATKATQDGAGNVITTTYATKGEVGALTTDNIGAGTQTWIFNCGSASTVLDQPTA